MTRISRHCFSVSAFVIAAGFFSSAHGSPVSPGSPVPAASSVDCSEVYGQPATCRVVACGPHYTHFLGVWRGPFEDYVRSLSTPERPVYRPYQNRISYTPQDCLTNPARGETFVVGHETNTYPPFKGLSAQTTQALIITGSKADGMPFLRMVDTEGRYDYAQLSKDAAHEGAVWQLDVPASNHPCSNAADSKKPCGSPKMRFRVSDSRDLSRNPANVRDVTVEMTIGPASHPYWSGVISRGQHERQGAGQL